MIPPLFPFYGSKWRDARRYPPPRHGRVIEPFAGSAGYSLWYQPAKVLLFDLDPIIVGVWNYLINAEPAEILALPDLKPGETTDDLALPQEARWLIGFWLNRGSAQPKKTQTAYSRRSDRAQLVWGVRARQRIAAAHAAIAHWQVIEGDYSDVPRWPDTTYFVDPPYVDKGRYYRYHDVEHLAVGVFAQGLPGDVIVCEQEGAEWLPFQLLNDSKSTRGRTAEVVWTK